MDIQKIKLVANSLSKKAKKEIITLLPTAKTCKKTHVAGIGYVLYIYDEKMKSIAHSHKDNGNLFLYIKEN